MSNKPKHFLAFKIAGFAGVVIGIIGISLSVSGFGDFDTNNFMIGGFMTMAGLMTAFPCLAIGFSPEIAKTRAKTAKYIQEENKDDLTDIANTAAEITSGAVERTARAAKEGFAEKRFCPYCGARIVEDAKFCSSCGERQ